MFKSLAKIEGLERRLDRLMGSAPEAGRAHELTDLSALSLLDFVPAASPHLVRPDHLLPYATLLELAIVEGEVRAVIAAPPQHGKTQLTEHALLWACIKYPGRKHAYVSYSAERAEYVSAEFQRLATELGLEPTGRLSGVRLKGGTEVRFIGVGGGLTGFSVNGLLIVDDPVKDRAEAESPTIRRKCVDWFTDVARSRRAKTTSILVMATRWHPEDLSGELVRLGYQYINLKAIAEGPLADDGTVANDPLHRRPGEALWPSEKPAEFFAEERQDAYSWASLYQGEPRGRGESIFRAPDLGDPEDCSKRFYDVLPDAALARVVIGVDFAYTAKTHADYSVAVVLGAVESTYYVLDVVRLQVEPKTFGERLRLLAATYPSSVVSSYVASTEKGGLEFVRSLGLQVQGLSANTAGDKFTRALPAAAAWNNYRVKLPAKADWLSTFLSEVIGFTGLHDRHDDQVDALAAAVHSLRTFVVDWDYLDRLATAWPAPLSF